MTPYEVARHMVRARRPDGTPLDAGLVVAYLEREAEIRGVDPLVLLPLRGYEVLGLSAASIVAFGRSYTRALLDVARGVERALLLVRRDLGDDGPRQSDFALAE